MLRGAKETEESDDGQVNDVAVRLSFSLVLRIEDFAHMADDAGVDWVGSGAWVILVGESFEKRLVCGCEFSCARMFSGILCTQVGDPLPHRQQGIANCSSTDLLAPLARLAVGHTEDQDVVESEVFWDVSETFSDVVGLAEALPNAKDLASPFAGLRCDAWLASCIAAVS